MIKEIEHFSWSGMNQFENDIHTYYTRYVLWEEPNYCVNMKNAMKFGKNYELLLSENEYKYRDTQKECGFIIGWYKAYGLFDFYKERPYWEEFKWEVVEVKTRNRWWTEDDIHKSWQFRIYNYWCKNNKFRFRIHQYNKKEWKMDWDFINRDDTTFEQDFVSKCEQIERFLKQFNIWVKHYDI